MKTAKLTSTLPATLFGGESLPLAPLLALAAVVRHTRTRTRVNELRVLLFAISHAGFYPKELHRVFDLQSEGAITEVRCTLKEMERSGLLNSQKRGNGRIYFCTNQGRNEAARLGAALIAEANEVLQCMKLDTYCRMDTIGQS